MKNNYEQGTNYLNQPVKKVIPEISISIRFETNSKIKEDIDLLKQQREKLLMFLREISLDYYRFSFRIEDSVQGNYTEQYEYRSDVPSSFANPNGNSTKG